ncbi:phosphatase PAP2 family protein [Polyangium aurulentum]|uniref:phosphatase PAP2 family protein n=1 Tax=Polyangium aurulentum TaxID=2567896 RepID=UPI00146B3FD0|nr:phosphatase PAP2 family protein [Polyangium aurulentum]UQA59750.1 phosphatase PAP2 family protein [Polyangium aurulentum]
MELIDTIAAVDHALLRASRGTPDWATVFFFAITTVGGGWGALAILPFLAQRATRVTAAWLVAALLATSGTVTLIKALVGRARPCDSLEWCAPVFGASPGGHSFPSGHAAGSFAFALFVSMRKPTLAPLALAFAACVAWSRVHLGVHYPTDVMAGALLGSAFGAAFAWASTRYFTDPWRSGSRSTAASHPAPDGSGRPG